MLKMLLPAVLLAAACGRNKPLNEEFKGTANNTIICPAHEAAMRTLPETVSIVEDGNGNITVSVQAFCRNRELLGGCCKLKATRRGDDVFLLQGSTCTGEIFGGGVIIAGSVRGGGLLQVDGDKLTVSLEGESANESNPATPCYATEQGTITRVP